MLVQSCLLLIPIGFWAYHTREVPRDLIAFEFVKRISWSWRSGGLEVPRGAF